MRLERNEGCTESGTWEVKGRAVSAELRFVQVSKRPCNLQRRQYVRKRLRKRIAPMLFGVALRSICLQGCTGYMTGSVGEIRRWCLLYARALSLPRVDQGEALRVFFETEKCLVW